MRPPVAAVGGVKMSMIALGPSLSTVVLFFVVLLASLAAAVIVLLSDY